MRSKLLDGEGVMPTGGQGCSLASPTVSWRCLEFNTISSMKWLPSLIPTSLQACSLKKVKPIGFLAPQGHRSRGRSPARWWGLAMGCPLCEARQDAPLTGIRGLSSRSGLGHDPRKEEQGAFHLPQASPRHQASRIPAARASPPKPAFSAPRLFPAPPHTLDGLAPAPGTRTVREYADAEGRPAGLFAAGASAQAPSWNLLRRESLRSESGGVRGRVPGILGRLEGGGRAWGLAVWLPAPLRSGEAKPPQSRPQARLGAGWGMRWSWRVSWTGKLGTLVPAVLRVRPAGERGRHTKRGLFGEMSSPGIATLPGCAVHLGEGPFRTERNKFGPGTWTTDIFSAETHPLGKLGQKNSLLPARMG